MTDTRVLHFPYMSTDVSETSGTRGTAYSLVDIASTDSALTISTKRISAHFIDRADLPQLSFNAQMETSERQGAVLSERIETALLADHGNWVNVGDPGTGIVTGDTTNITVGAANVDDIVRAVRRIVNEANGQDLAAKNGIFIVWRAADFEFLEAFAQANGFQLADLALKNGIPDAYFFLGCYHYVSNNHASGGHLFAGVRNIVKTGILRTTWGQLVITQDPNLQSGIGLITRADYGFLVPAGLSTLVYDINVA